ncbi:hypothetical protein [Streptomyces sp. NPDC051994]|uniref:hypothetical protein n=1 Tax=Streptomyces sp. NPDC051994 TaxID=3155287 RepID=UPI003445C01E
MTIDTSAASFQAAEQEAVRRSVDAQFPLVPQLLADRPSGAPLPLLPAMPAQPHPEQAAARPDDRHCQLVLEAEIFQDPDGGDDSLIVTTDDLACEPVSPARLRLMVAEARTKLDEIERLAAVYEAEDTIRAIVAEHDIDLQEWDGAELPPRLRKQFVAFGVLDKHDQLIIMVPTGQDPIQRAAILAHLGNRMGGGQ